MRSLKHSLIFFALAGVLIAYGFKFFAFISLAIGLTKFYNWYQHPHRELWGKIKKDAQKFQVRIPAKLAVKQNLLKLYSRVEILKIYHPYTKETLSDLIYSMWKGLKYNPNTMSWAHEINQTALALPSFNQIELSTTRNEFQNKMRRDQELWERAAQKAKQV